MLFYINNPSDTQYVLNNIARARWSELLMNRQLNVHSKSYHLERAREREKFNPISYCVVKYIKKKIFFSLVSFNLIMERGRELEVISSYFQLETNRTISSTNQLNKLKQIQLRNKQMITMIVVYKQNLKSKFCLLLICELFMLLLNS